MELRRSQDEKKKRDSREYERGKEAVQDCRARQLSLHHNFTIQLLPLPLRRCRNDET